jgi:hypothetical protein
VRDEIEVMTRRDVSADKTRDPNQNGHKSKLSGALYRGGRGRG